MKKKKFFIFGVLTVLLISALLIFTGCPSSESPGTSYSYTLYVTDTSNGGVYAYDLEKHSFSSTPVVSTGQNATGAIYFYDDKGYICVGYSTGGIYTFDPNSTSPTTTKFSSLSFAAQYIAFLNDKTAFVTDYGDYNNPTTTGGVYMFDPSDANSSFTFITDTTGNTQDIKIYNKKVYVASYGNNKIFIIDTENNNTVTSVDIPSGTGPSMLDFSSDNTKLYITNSSWGETGTISVLNLSDNSISTLVSLTGYHPMAIAANLNYLYVGASDDNYGNHVLIVNLNDNSFSELLDKDGNSFGASSILIHNDLIYFSGGYGNNYIKIFDASTNQEVDYSPVYIGSTDNPDSIGATGLAVYLKEE